jgi:hypothetical protein
MVMTHDELMERLHIEQGCPVGDALRAVVELHKPNGGWFCNACANPNDEVLYPCPTIQAIEKELK